MARLCVSQSVVTKTIMISCNQHCRQIDKCHKHDAIRPNNGQLHAAGYLTAAVSKYCSIAFVLNCLQLSLPDLEKVF